MAELVAVELSVREKEQQLINREWELLEADRRRQTEEALLEKCQRAHVRAQESERLGAAVEQVLPKAIERLKAYVNTEIPRPEMVNPQLLRVYGHGLYGEPPFGASGKFKLQGRSESTDPKAYAAGRTVKSTVTRIGTVDNPVKLTSSAEERRPEKGLGTGPKARKTCPDDCRMIGLVG